MSAAAELPDDIIEAHECLEEIDGEMAALPAPSKVPTAAELVDSPHPGRGSRVRGRKALRRRTSRFVCHSARVGDDYYDDLMLNRQRLLWTIATRQQLERWEPLVAAAVRRSLDRRQLDDSEIWQAEIEHHFTLVAIRNLFHALDLPPASSIPVDPTLRSELIEGRDLHEHWRDNLPVFNVTPRTEVPKYPSGKRFAERNPDVGPYDWLAWSSKTGARLLPNVSAPALHQLLDAVEAEVLGKDAALSRFLPPRAPSPWHQKNGEWWPKAVSS